MLLKHPDIIAKPGKYSLEGIDTKTFESVTSALHHYMEYRNASGVLIIIPSFDSICLPNVEGRQKPKTLWNRKYGRYEKWNKCHNDTISMFVKALHEVIAYCVAKNEYLCIYLQTNNRVLRQTMIETEQPHHIIDTNPDSFIANKQGVLLTDSALVEGYEFPVVLNLFDEQTHQKKPMVVDMLHRAVSSSNTVRLPHIDPDNDNQVYYEDRCVDCMAFEPSDCDCDDFELA